MRWKLKPDSGARKHVVEAVHTAQRREIMTPVTIGRAISPKFPKRRGDAAA